MFSQLRNKIFLFLVLFLSLISLGQDSIPTLDLRPLFTKTKDMEQYEDSLFAERGIYTSSIDSLWYSVYGTDNFDISDFLNDLIMLKLKRGLDRIPDFSRTLCYHISEFIIDRDISREELNRLDENIDKILIIDPYSTEAYTLKSKITLKKSIIYFIPAVYYHIKGLVSNLSTIENISNYIPSLIYFLHFTFILSGFAFFIILLIKYLPLLIHEAREMFGVSRNSRTILFITGLLTVFWLYAGIIPLMVFFGALLFIYSQNAERTIILLCLLSMALTILSFDYFSQYAALGRSEITQALISSYSKEYDPRVVMKLEEYHKINDSNIAVKFALANFYSRKGKIFQALTIYNSIEQKINFPELYINIGNIYYILNDYYKAQSYYEKVADQSMLQGIAAFNLAQMSLEKMTFSQDTHKYFDLSKDYYPELINLYQKISHKHINLIVSAGLPKKLLFQHMKTEMENSGNNMKVALMGFDPDEMPYIGILSVIFILVVNLFRIRMDLAYRCKKCGKIFCGKCSTRFFSDTICSSCHQVFVIKKGIHPKVRVEKIINIDKHKKNLRLLSKILTLFTLGGGYVLFDKALKGFIMIFFYISLFVFLFGPVPIFPEFKLPFVYGFMLGKYFIAVIIAIILYNSIKAMDKISQKYHAEK